MNVMKKKFLIGKNHTFKICDQFDLKSSCFLGRSIRPNIPSNAISRFFFYKNNEQISVCMPKNFMKSEFKKQLVSDRLLSLMKYFAFSPNYSDDENDNIENYDSIITEDIEYQENSNDKPYKCEKCFKTFSTKKYLQAHMSRHGPRLNKCEHCEKSYVEKRDLQTHMFKIHGIGKSSATDDNFNGQDQKKEYSCTKCPKTFAELRYLRIHSRRHNDDNKAGISKNFKCDRCSKSFSEKRYLQAHKARHEDLKKFKCEICGRNYAEKRNLQAHMLRHEGKKFPCDKCPKKFYSERELENHIEKIHTLDSPDVKIEVQEPKCEVCHKTFAHKQSLANHIATVHEKKTIVQCEICGKDFSCKGNLSIHMNNVHSDGKIHICHVCGKKFK